MSEKLEGYIETFKDELACSSSDVRTMLDDIGSTCRIVFWEVATRIVESVSVEAKT